MEYFLLNYCHKLNTPRFLLCLESELLAWDLRLSLRLSSLERFYRSAQGLWFSNRNISDCGVGSRRYVEMFYVVSKAMWSVLSPSNALILVSAAGTLAIVFIYQQWIAGVVKTTSIFLLAANFTPLWMILAKPLRSRFIEPNLEALQVRGLLR